MNEAITEAVDKFARKVHEHQERGIESVESLVDTIGEVREETR
jgi:hypothetical protein